MKFCPHCGKELSAGQGCSCPDAQKASCRKGNGKFGSRKRIFLIAAAAIVLIVLIAVLVFAPRAKTKFDLSDYIVIEGVSGLNGNGTVDYYLDEERLILNLLNEMTHEEVTEENYEAILQEWFEKYEEIGNALSCITITASPETDLSNGDTVTVTAEFENAADYELSFVLLSGSKSMPVSGLRDGIPTDAFADGAVTVSFSGFNGDGQATLETAVQGENAPAFKYVLSQESELKNGDIVTVTAEYDAAQFETLGFLAPEVITMEYTVFGLAEYFDITSGILEDDLAALTAAALAGSRDAEAAEAADGMEIVSGSEFVGTYFLEVKDWDTTYRDGWHRFSMKNAVVTVTKFTAEFTSWSASSRTYWVLRICPNCTASEDGHIVYREDDVVSYSVWRDSYEDFYAWMEEEFEVLSITIVELAAAAIPDPEPTPSEVDPEPSTSTDPAPAVSDPEPAVSDDAPADSAKDPEPSVSTDPEPEPSESTSTGTTPGAGNMDDSAAFDEEPGDLTIDDVVDLTKDWDTDEFKREVAQWVVYYINQYRAEEGTPELTVLPGMTLVSEYRADQIITNFSHDTADIREAHAYYGYGVYFDATLFGDDASKSYWGVPGSQEAIASIRANPQCSAADIGYSIATAIRNSSNHWSYIGNNKHCYIAAGTEYTTSTYRNWYCCVIVSIESYE